MAIVLALGTSFAYGTANYLGPLFARRWPLAHVKSANLRDALDGVLWTELVDRTQMRYYFPDSHIISERILGWTKSLIAVQRA